MTTLLFKHKILLGVTGGIAAYKSADLTRRLQDAGAEVRVVMTPDATEFVRPLTFQALSGFPVRLDLLDPDAEAARGHIELARWAYTILVAPASVDFIARLAAGMANDLLTILCLASDAPIVLAPAMNRLMWQNAATQDNVSRLLQRGIRLLGPAAGGQACGEVGEGRMMEPLDLVQELARDATVEQSLAGTTVLLTAGPTREAIDPVRFISNRSSGRMGFAVAEAARRAGAQVVLVAGPTSLPTPPGVERVDVTSAEQMYQAVMQRVAAAEIFIGTAAVADYRPAEVVQSKIKKKTESLQLELEPTQDILQTVAMLPEPPFTVGFAAETDELERFARDKLVRKQLDMIAANWVGGETGFDSEDNALEVFWSDGQHSLERQDKDALALQLIELIAKRYHAKHTIKNT